MWHVDRCTKRGEFFSPLSSHLYEHIATLRGGPKARDFGESADGTLAALHNSGCIRAVLSLSSLSAAVHLPSVSLLFKRAVLGEHCFCYFRFSRIAPANALVPFGGPFASSTLAPCRAFLSVCYIRSHGTGTLAGRPTGPDAAEDVARGHIFPYCSDNLLLYVQDVLVVCVWVGGWVCVFVYSAACGGIALAISNMVPFRPRAC